MPESIITTPCLREKIESLADEIVEKLPFDYRDEAALEFCEAVFKKGDKKYQDKFGDGPAASEFTRTELINHLMRSGSKRYRVLYKKNRPRKSFLKRLLAVLSRAN